MEKFIILNSTKFKVPYFLEGILIIILNSDLDDFLFIGHSICIRSLVEDLFKK